MKIAHVTCVYPPYRGGIGTDAFHVARMQALLGHDVCVFTPNEFGENCDLWASRCGARRCAKSTAYYAPRFQHHISSIFTKLPKVGLRENPVEIDALPRVEFLWPVFRYGNAALLIQLFWKLRRYDIVHLHYPFFGSAWIVWVLKKIFQRKFIFILRYHMDVVGTGVLKSFFSFHTRFLMPIIVSCADRVLVSTFDYAQHSNVAAFYARSPEKFFEVPFGVDAQVFVPIKKDVALLGHYGINDDAKVLLFVGGLDRAHYFKGLEYVLDALKQVDALLIIVGQGGDLEEYYRKKVFDLGLEKRVIFAGTVSEEELPKYYNLCDIFVLPSIDRSEAFGLVYLEAMACAKPVVGSDLPGVRRVIEHERNGLLVQPRDAAGLAVALNRLLNDPYLCVKYGAVGRKTVENRYDWEKIVQKTLEAYIF